MNGLIVLEPYCTDIINGKKDFEYRNTSPPKHNRNVPIYLLSGGHILGIIKIEGFGLVTWGTFNQKYYWRIKVISKYKTRKKYNHPNGAQVWVKHVGHIVKQTTL